MSLPTAPDPHPGYWTPQTAPRFGNPTRPPGNTFAWLGLIISVSGFLIPVGVNGLLGAAFSVVGLREARKLREAGHPESQTGHTIAVAGLITGIVNIVVTAAAIVAGVLLTAWFVDWMNTLTIELQNSNLSSSLPSLRSR